MILKDVIDLHCMLLQSTKFPIYNAEYYRNWQKIENLSVFGLLFVCNLYLELCQISLQQFQRCGNCILVGTLVAVGSVDTGADESVSGINTGA